MPKISVVEKTLYKKWFLTIQSIDKTEDPKKEILSYLTTNKNAYTEKILFFLSLNRKKTDNYEKHHVFPKGVGGANKPWNFGYVTHREHRNLHKLRFFVYHESVDKFAQKSSAKEKRKKKIQLIKKGLKKNQIWVYQKKSKTFKIKIKALSCLTLEDLVQKLESTKYAVGNVKTTLVEKTSGLATVILGRQKNYGGWSLAIKNKI